MIDRIEPIHSSIVAAICSVQSSLSAIGQDGKNSHGGYRYASTDAIYAALTLKLADAGLLILCLEDGQPEILRVEKEGKTSQWGKFAFRFVLATSEATWSDPGSRRSLFTQITGPQTHMAAQSYCEKAYLRSLFKMATGDHDLDAMPQADSEDEQVALNGNGKSKRKSSSSAKKDGTDKVFNEIKAKLEEAATPDMLQQIRTLYSEEWDQMPMQWNTLLDNTYEDRMTDLRRAMQ